MMNKALLAALSATLITVAGHAQPIYSIQQYHAVGDGKTINTRYIQRAIDDCAAKGGGTVWVPAGTWLTGGIQLKSQVNLHLANGAVLKANPDIKDYSGEHMAVVRIDHAENVSVTGQGTIDGNGKNFAAVEEGKDRPFVLLVHTSKMVTIRDVRLHHAARWTLRLLSSDQVLVDGVHIYSHANHNNDGIDIDSKNVVIANCNIDSDDDGICLKSEVPGQITENVIVSNCIIASNCNFIKMGTGSYGGFRNIAISNCVLKPAAESPLRQWHRQIKGITDTISGLAGIALEVVDGGVMDQVVIQNIIMTGVQTPVFIRLGQRKNPVGSIKNILISNITARANSLIPSVITAVPGYAIENVVCRDWMLIHTGGGTQEHKNRTVPEQEAKYPENRMFGHSLPAWGLYVRHAKNITVDNVQFTCTTADARPAVWLDDVQGFYMLNDRQAVADTTLLYTKKASAVFYNHIRQDK